MTHQRVSLFLNIFSLQSCIFILSERGCCYGLHTKTVYGFFNQHQIMKSRLHLWAHPQKLDACMTPLHPYTRTHTNDVLRLLPVESEQNRMKVCIYFGPAAAWGDRTLSVFCTWCHRVLIISAIFPSLLTDHLRRGSVITYIYLWL